MANMAPKWPTWLPHTGNIGLTIMVLLILHLLPLGIPEKLPPMGHIKLPLGRKLPPLGLKPSALWPLGGNLALELLNADFWMRGRSTITVFLNTVLWRVSERCP